MHYEYIYKSNRFESRRHRRTKKSFKGLILLIGLIVLGYYFSGFVLQVVRNKNTVTVASPLAEPVAASIDTIKGVVSPSKLPQVVSASLEGTTGTYAVVIKNLKTGESYALNDKREFDSASLYKLWVMTTTYQIIETGKLDPDSMLNRPIEELNKKFDIATESAELTEGQFNMSVQNALHQMITISHNYAALALSERIGLSNVTKFLKNTKLEDSNLGGDSLPRTTAADVALFYEKLYRGELGNKDSTASMMELLKKQQLNDRIPKYLPEGTIVGHKTGELGYVKHDAGIVFTPFGDYIVVILSESKNPAAAAERQALLSKAVYEYFEASTE